MLAQESDDAISLEKTDTLSPSALHLLLWLFSLPLCLSAQNAWQRAADRLAAHPSLRHGQLSLCVLDLQTGKELAAINPDKSLRPASSLKVLTTGTALLLLGPDYRFRTELRQTGSITADGRLEGDLLIRGYGDPTLGSPLLPEGNGPEEMLRQLRLAVQRAGIRSISGKIVGDARLYGSNALCPSWEWEDLGNYYAAGTWSLNWHENFYYLHLDQRPRGQQPEVAGWAPPVPGLRILNELRSGAPGSGDQAYLYGAPYQFARYLRGSIPAGRGTFTIKGALPNPPLLLAQELKRALAYVAIPSGPATAWLDKAQGDRPGRLLFTHRSPTLAAVAKRCNMESVNLYSEALLRALAFEQEGRGSVDGALALMQSYWESRGLSWRGVYLEDGSGLSGGNLVPARFMAAFMRKMALGPEEAAVAFRASLPVAGRSGSMEYSLRGTRAQGRLQAKSGTLRRVRSFTGYATDRSGRELAFCVMANDFSGSGGEMRRRLEGFLQSLCEN